jgi:lysophospholipase L1-like esterase
VRLTELQTALEEFHPDVVIIESCCNYDGTYALADGTVVRADSELLWDAWAAQAQRMVSVAEAHAADVYMVITPRPLNDSWFTGLTNRVAHFNAIYRSLGVPLIDWDAALYPDGSTAGLERLRNADGLHLTDAGDDRVAAATWSAIAGAFR